MKSLLFCLMISALLLVPISLWAQDLVIPEEVTSGYSFTAGAMWAINGDLPDQSARPLLGVAWYGPAGETFGQNATVGLSAEWLNYERFDGDTVNLFPINLNLKFYTAASGWRLFAVLGAGILASTDDIPELGLSNGANFGWTGKLGVDITEQFFVQGNFIASSDPGDDGFAGVQLGYRF